jgi:hypothetical protein
MITLILTGLLVALRARRALVRIPAKLNTQIGPS